MDFFKILTITLCFFTTAIAGFKQRFRNDRWQRISNLQPPILNTIDLEDFDIITSLFPNCNLYIISPGIHISKLSAVAQPRLYYTDFKQYLLDSFYIPGPGYGATPATPTFWDLASKATCKAEIAVDWMTVPKGRAAFPRILIQDFFTLEPRLDSNFVYHVLIGFKGTKYPNTMFRWAHALQSYKTFRGALAKTYRATSFNFIRYMYYFRYSKVSKRRGRRIGPRPTNHPIDAYKMLQMGRSCMACRPHDIVTRTRKKLAAKKKLQRLAAHAKNYGTVAAHDLAFRLLKKTAAVCILGSAIESNTFFEENAQIAMDEMFSSYLTVKHESEADRHLEGRKVLARAITPVLPESVLIHFLMQKHNNMTFFLTGDWRRPGGAPLYDGSADTIHGPGFPRFFIDRAWYATHVPVGFSSLRFVTCSNITITPRSGLLSMPFDRSTWIWLCISVGAVCAVLQLTMKNRRNLTGLLPLFFMVTRILLDNFQDISSKLKKWPTAFAIVAATTALCGITLTNGYRGVLTSDLVMAPGISGPKTFHDILDDGVWDFFLYYSSRFTKAAERRYGTLINMLFIETRLSDKLVEAGLNVSTYEPRLKSKELTTLTYAEYIKIRSNALKNHLEAINHGTINCPCNRTAFITLETSLLDLNLPESCMKKIDYVNFVRGTDHILPKTLHWSSRWERSGLAWESLVRLLESGLYGWLNQMLRHIRGELVANGQNIRASETEFGVAALQMNTLIVESSFSVWRWMILASISTLVMELVVYFFSISFSFVSVSKEES